MRHLCWLILLVGCKSDLKLTIVTTAEGTDAAAARDAVEQARPRIEACYRDDDVKSALVTDIPIDASGKIKSGFWPNGPHDPPLRGGARCVRDVLAKLAFPPGRDDTRKVTIEIVHASDADRKDGYGVHRFGSGGLQVGDPNGPP